MKKRTKYIAIAIVIVLNAGIAALLISEYLKTGKIESESALRALAVCASSIIMYAKLYLRERETLRKYDEIKRLKYEMCEIQGDKTKEKLLLEKFDKYKWLSTEKVKKELKNISITAIDIDKLPMMSIDELVEELKYKKSPESRADVIKARLNTQIRPYRDPLFEKK